MNSIDVGTLAKLFSADFERGELNWNSRPLELFDNSKGYASRQCATWNERFANAKAFIAVDSKGYAHGRVFGAAYRTHRVMWALYYGAWPSGEIDHINGVRSDNRISNLRVVDTRNNAKNKKRSGDNTSGFTGVVWNEKRKHWLAQIKVDYRQHYLGSFGNKEAAIEARKLAEIKFGFHPNHGRE